MCHSVAIITVKRSLFKTLKRKREGAGGAVRKKVQSATAGIAVAVSYYPCNSILLPAGWPPSDVLLIAVICNFKQRMINFSTREE